MRKYTVNIDAIGNEQPSPHPKYFRGNKRLRKKKAKQARGLIKCIPFSLSEFATPFRPDAPPPPRCLQPSCLCWSIPVPDDFQHGARDDA